MKEYIENEGLRLIDFFKLMDSDGSGSISRDEFVTGLTVLTDVTFSHGVTCCCTFFFVPQNANIILTTYQLDKLMSALDMDGDGEIDFG